MSFPINICFLTNNVFEIKSIALNPKIQEQFMGKINFNIFFEFLFSFS
jgi:hypothetical protein